MTDNRKVPSFITPPNTLKAKVGEGGIPAYILKQCQGYLESNPVDFTPYGYRYLSQLREVKLRIDKGGVQLGDVQGEMTNIIMQLKSNGSMFHYQLISMISDVMLRFFEHAKTLDDDFNEIFGVYTNVLEIVLNKKLRGNGGAEGYALTQELHGACLRYYTKHGIKI
ncbi:MAG TPA: hypothetical protein VFS88_00900 [Micavibrio sp.]|nr:hypothetical protein [Micavibrio sp.]